MTTRVATWGNSLALRLPRTVAAEAELRDGDAVDVTVEHGAIVVRPAARRYSIEDLVKGITPRCGVGFDALRSAAICVAIRFAADCVRAYPAV